MGFSLKGKTSRNDKKMKKIKGNNILEINSSKFIQKFVLSILE
jgi:hypothetical protein